MNAIWQGWLAWPLMFLRSCVQFAGMVGFTVLWATLSLFVAPLPYLWRYHFITRWSLFNLWWVERICGLGYEVQGLENIPEGPGVVMCKHQSTWETLGLIPYFTPQTWVLKRELTRIPMFGWALSLLEPIAIDRAGQGEAVRQMLNQGLERLRQGRWVIIYPEGTRVPPGQRGRYHPAGAMLACRAGCPVIPVAHNAGEYWARHQFVKRPGKIQLRIGPPIDTQGRKPKEVTALVEAWIEGQMQEISGQGR